MLLLGRDDTSNINSCWGRNDVVCGHSTTTVKTAADICFFVTWWFSPAQLSRGNLTQHKAQGRVLHNWRYFSSFVMCLKSKLD